MTAIGILSASPACASAIAHYADGSVDPALAPPPSALDEIGDILAGTRPSTAGPGPKFHVTPAADLLASVGLRWSRVGRGNAAHSTVDGG